MTFGDYICKSGGLIDSSPYLGVVYKCQYGRLGDHALSARRCWAPSDDGVGQSSVEESGLGLEGCVMNVVMKYSPC